jgi:integrase
MPHIIAFSKKKIDSLPIPPDGKRVDYYDEVQRDLILRITSNGSKSFYVRKYKSQGSDRFFLGKYPDLPVEAARKQAALVSARLAVGEDPNAAKQLKRSEPTVQQLFDNYMEGHAKQRCVRTYDMQADFRRYMLDWANKRYSSISRMATQAKLNQVHEKNGPAAANHMLVLMRAVFNWNIKTGIITGENPWGHLKQFKIQSRERFLKPDEVKSLFEQLEKTPHHHVRDFVLLCLYTGARRMNVLSMRWSEIDLKMGTWKIPRTKNGDWQIVPLTEKAIGVLRSRPAQEDSDWVFPGKDPSRHLVEPKRGWYAILDAAGIENFRLHDLRRTLGSYMAMSNQSLKMIGSALGHRSSSATEIYARIANDSLRSAMQQAQENMLKPLDSSDDQTDRSRIEEEQLPEGLQSQLADEDMQNASKALLRASRRAREIARQTKTAIVVMRDGQLIREFPHLEDQPPSNPKKRK